jgi:hypothetical protein
VGLDGLADDSAGLDDGLDDCLDDLDDDSDDTHTHMTWLMWMAWMNAHPLSSLHCCQWCNTLHMLFSHQTSFFFLLEKFYSSRDKKKLFS